MDGREFFDRSVQAGAAARQRILEIWVTSGFAEIAERLRRHPLFRPVCIGTTLLLAMVIAGVSSDEVLARSLRLVNLSAYDVSNAWFVMPLAFIVLVALCVSGRERMTGGGVALVLLGVLLAIRFDFRLATESVMSYLAIRESSDLLGYLLTGVALWLYTRFYPTGGGVVLALGLTGILVSRWSFGVSRSLFRPDLLPLLYSIPLAVSAAVDARANLSMPGVRPAPEARPGFHTTGLFAGGLTGALLHHIEQYRPGASQVTEALGSLWSQSVLAGYGYGPLMRLLRTATEPAAIADPRWMGWTGFLASGGAGLLLVLVVLSGLLIRRELHSRVEHRAGALGAQFTVGLIILGGPNSMIPLLLLIVWSALAFSAPLIDEVRRPEAAPFAFNLARFSRWSLVGTLILLAIVCLRFRRPFSANEILNEISVERSATPELEAALNRAESLNPWTPVAPLIRAAWLREALTESKQWDESLYRSICRAYEAAIRLDPYEPTIVLRLADVQSVAERSDAALATVEEALERTPGAVELIAWVYFHAMTHNRMEVAARMVERSLMLEPHAPRWWRDRFRFERDAGRGPRARVALHVALTSAIDDPDEIEKELIRTAFLRREAQP